MDDQASWAVAAIEDTCQRVQVWYRSLPEFPNRVNLGSVVGFRHPALVSEQDCVMQFARFLNDAGVPWDAIHHEVSVSRWLFDKPHPAATAGGSRWRVDLALIRTEDFLAAHLPATEPGFQFEACLEFAYLSDYWNMPGAVRFGAPANGRKKVEEDVKKIGNYLERGVCQSGYVIVFEECDGGFPPSFAADANAKNGCRVRFVRGL